MTRTSNFDEMVHEAPSISESPSQRSRKRDWHCTYFTYSYMHPLPQYISPIKSKNEIKLIVFEVELWFGYSMIFLTICVFVVCVVIVTAAVYCRADTPSEWSQKQRHWLCRQIKGKKQGQISCYGS